MEEQSDPRASPFQDEREFDDELKELNASSRSADARSSSVRRSRSFTGYSVTTAERRLSRASALFDRGNKGYLDDVEKTARAYDRNGDGRIDTAEVFRIVEDLQAAQRRKNSMKKYLFLSVGATMVLMLAVFGLMWAVVLLTRQVVSDENGVLRTASHDRAVVATKGMGYTLRINTDSQFAERRMLAEESYDQEQMLAEIEKTEANSLWSSIESGTTVTFEFYAKESTTATTAKMEVNKVTRDEDTDLGVWYIRGIKEVDNTGLVVSGENDDDEDDVAQEYTIACAIDGHDFSATGLPESLQFISDTDTYCAVFFWYVPWAIVSVERNRAVVGYRHYTKEIISLVYGPNRNLDVSGTTVEYLDDSGNQAYPLKENDYTVTFFLNNLTPDSDYFYRIKVGNELLDPGRQQSFRTLPGVGTPFMFTIFSDVANHWANRAAPAYKNARQVSAVDATFAMQIGDFDHSDPETEAEMQQLHRYMRAPYFLHGNALGKFVLSKMGFHHIWDDHDYCGQDTDKSCLLRDEAIKIFRDYYPRDDYPSQMTDGNYYSFISGDAEIFVLDTRSNRDPDFLPNRDWKSMLGLTQRDWLRNGLLASTAKWKIIVSTVTANMSARPANIDHWMSKFRNEAAIMKEFIETNNLKDSTIMITADLHTGGGIDDGCNNGWGIPELNVPHTNLAGGNSNFVGNWTHGIQNGTSRTAGFGVVSVETDTLTMEVYDRTGALQRSLTLPNTPIEGCTQTFLDTPGGLQTCSGEPVRWVPLPPSTGNCTDYEIDVYQTPNPVTGFVTGDGHDMVPYVQFYKCPSSGIKIMRSNGIPNHEIVIPSLQNQMCTTEWHIEWALDSSIPTFPGELGDAITTSGGFKVESAFLLGFSWNGIPLFNAQETNGTSAVEPDEDAAIQGAKYWHGHPTGNETWHYHSPYIGKDVDCSDCEGLFNYTVPLGFAMDGYPIYGPFDEDSEEWNYVDECNFYNKAGEVARYVVRLESMVDESLPFCSDIDEETNNWNYIIGCYRGDLTQTKVKDWSSAPAIPDDCEEVDFEDLAPYL